MNRRKFIRNIGLASASSVVLSGVPLRVLAGNERLKRIAANGNDNVLIFVQLHGGNDALNTLIPIDQYHEYYNFRPNIAIPDKTSRKFIPVDNSLPVADQVGLHPDMIGFKALYDEGKATIVQNVGYPNMNMSHFRGRDIVFMGGGSGDYFSSGWMGRFLDYEYPGYPDAYPNQTMPDPIGIELGNVISLAFHREEGIPIGINIQNPEQFYDLITNVGVEPPIAFPDSHAGDELRYLMEFEKKSNQYAERLKQAYDNGSNSATVSYPENYPLTAPERFLHNPLSGQLKLIARLLKGGLKTRIFLCRIGGFDTHGEQVEKVDSTMGAHAALLYHLSSAIKAFQDDLAGLGQEERVLTMTFTEFGRRVYSNASYGTDHGTATPIFLFGKGLKGGVVGTNPDLNDLNAGNIKFAIDYRNVYTSVVQDWFGASDDAMKATGFDEWTSSKIDLFSSPTGTSGGDFTDNTTRLLGCYPNPASGNTTLEYFLQKPGSVYIEIYYSSGRLVKQFEPVPGAFGYQSRSIDLSGLDDGLYIIKLRSDKFAGTVQVVKQ
jgi:uncharacterized protein (DUF1501 family)